ncbi:hypothetical protein ACERIT_11450 [Halopenitus sp. H-Gu1]|uniref:hypothetical protein n=1 Tax=Halopenitus sp. H-Gu1 TaxID=3242697 RepID=UPI00359D0620
MNLDELRSVQAKERRKDSLQHLRDAFYDDVAAYITDLRDARDRRAERVENPFSDDDVRRLSDEIETAEEVAEALYERRVGKVVKLASFAAADMPVEQEGMTSQERALFEDLVTRIERNKSSVLDVLSGATAPNPEGEASTASPDDEASTAPPDDDRLAPESPPTAPTSEEAPHGAGGTVDPSDSPSRTNDPPLPPEESLESDAAGGTDTAQENKVGMLADAMAGSDESSADGTQMGEVPTDEAPQDVSDDVEGSDQRPPANPPHIDTDGSSSEEDDSHASDSNDPENPVASTAVETGSTSTPAEATDNSSLGDTSERTTVRITRDVGSILGVDEREYHLASEDVVSLPSTNAEPLLARDAAERIE